MGRRQAFEFQHFVLVLELNCTEYAVYMWLVLKWLVNSGILFCVFVF